MTLASVSQKWCLMRNSTRSPLSALSLLKERVNAEQTGEVLNV